MNTIIQQRNLSSTSRVGNWLPWSPEAIKSWLAKKIHEAEKEKKEEQHVIALFRKLIEDDPIMYMYFTQMFEQQPDFVAPVGSGDVKLTDYNQMLKVINHVLSTAPEFNKTEMVGFPINAILDFPMITPAGLAAFASPQVNQMLKKILKVWTEFLDSPASRYILNKSENGWLSEAALQALNMDEIDWHPDKPYGGFQSWNDFFIRQFKHGLRPVSEPDNDKVIVSACESAPFNIDTNISKSSKFWLKGQPYSLQHLLDGHHVDYYQSGTVYQAYLSAENYHRWHSPVDGIIKEVYLVDGTYYSEASSVGFDPVGPNNSQGYIAHTAARGLIFIESLNQTIGLVCVVTIGMAEVSSSVITVEAGQHVKKGDQIGYFQFGGSTHCLVFKAGSIAEFSANAIPQGEYGANSTIVKLNSKIAISH